MEPTQEKLLSLKCIDLKVQFDVATQFLDTFKALPSRVKLACAAAILRRVSLIAVVDGEQAIASRLFPLTKPASLQRYPLPGTKSLLQQFDELPESCKAGCLAAILKSLPVSIIVGAFESDYVELGEFEQAPGRRTGCYIFSGAPSDDAVKAIANACIASKPPFAEDN